MILIPYILFGIAYYSSYLGRPAWFTRKLIHTFGLSIVGIYGATLDSIAEVMTIMVVFLLILAILSLVPNLQLFQSLIEKGTREGEKKSESVINTTFTSISILSLLVFSFDERWYFLAGTLAVAIGDGLGEFIGRPYGKHKYKVIANKSIEGSFGVFIGTFIGIFVTYTFFGIFEFTSMFFIALVLASCLSMIIEAVSISFMDNVLIPWGVAGILFLLIG